MRAELVGPRRTPKPSTGAQGTFVDRHGTGHRLDPGLRDRLKPGWQMMLDPDAVAQPPSDATLAERAAKAATLVGEADVLIASVAGRQLAGRILEIGCYDGAIAFELARRPGTAAVASDLARYYVVQRPGQPVESDVTAQQAFLTGIRERARAVAGVAPGIVQFVEDDITTSRLEPGTFDAIVSFEVLEHVQRPVDAFAAMARLLKPGGVAYHDYNPFFSAKGGHSLCTLDFPWGHARLDAGDFERYVREYRPAEIDQARRFYRESLNRMTIADLRSAIAAAGLELLMVLPWSERPLASRLEPSMIDEVRREHPTATAEDLLATFVGIVLRRPTEPA